MGIAWKDLQLLERVFLKEKTEEILVALRIYPLEALSFIFISLHVPSLKQENMDEKNVDDSAEKMPPPPSRQEQATIEKAEEQKLRANLAKYPHAVNKNLPINMPAGGGGGGAGGGGHSAFLQKRLAKGQKYFDSGDYQMAKQKGPRGPGRLAIPVLAQPPTGDTIPTPDTVPARKTSIIQPLHDHSQSMPQAADPSHAGISSLLPPPVTPGQPMP